MTERARRAPKRRASKRELRITAWLAGGLAFATPFGALAASPKPPAPSEGPPDGRRPVTIRRVITRRIVVVHPAPASSAATFVPEPSAPSGSAPPAPAPSQPAPPPATSSGGS